MESGWGGGSTPSMLSLKGVKRQSILPLIWAGVSWSSFPAGTLQAQCPFKHMIWIISFMLCCDPVLVDLNSAAPAPSSSAAAAYRDIGTMDGFLGGKLTKRMSLLSWMVTVVPFLSSMSSPFLNNPFRAPAAAPIAAPTPKPFRFLPLTAPITPPSTAPSAAPETVSSPWFPGAWSVPCSSV